MFFMFAGRGLTLSSQLNVSIDQGRIKRPSLRTEGGEAQPREATRKSEDAILTNSQPGQKK
jgi:hypothetical protein